jgi:MFS family permease
MKRSPLLIIFLTVFIDLVGFGIVIPVLPYYAESLGAASFTVGLLSSSYSLMQFLFTPVWGRLSDRYGRRPLILVSLAGSCVGFLIFGLAHSLLLLFTGRILAGIAGAIIPTTNAYIADVTTPENRARGMGVIGAAFGLGFTLGPAIGGLLAPYGYGKPALLASAMAGINLVFAYYKLPESLQQNAGKATADRWFSRKHSREILRRPRTGLLLSIYFVATFAFAGMESTFGLLNAHVYGLSARQTGYLFTFIGVLMSLMQGVFVGRLVDRLGEKACIALGTFVMVFGIGLLPFASSLTVYCAFVALLAFGAGVNNPAITALLSRCSHENEQGGVMGVAQSISSLGRIGGPLWGGYAFDALGARWPFVSGGTIMLIAFLLSLRTFSSDWRTAAADPRS